MEIVEQNNLKNKNDIKLDYYQNQFIKTLLLVANFCKDISVKNITELQIPKTHLVLRNNCNDLINCYSNIPINEDDKKLREKVHIDVIKKMYKIFYKNLNLVENKDDKLFKLIKNNCIETLIPGINITIILKFLSEEEHNLLWQNIHILFVYNIRIIYLINTDRKKENVINLLKQIENTLSKQKLIFNLHYLGIEDELSNNILDTNSIIENTKNIILPDSQTTGFNSADITKSLQDMKSEDIDFAVKSITELLGSSGDDDVNETVKKLVIGVIDDLKENGITGILNAPQRISEKVGNKLDTTKFAKTAQKMMSKMDEVDTDPDNVKNMFSKLNLPPEIFNTVKQFMKQNKTT